VEDYIFSCDEFVHSLNVIVDGCRKGDLPSKNSTS
jgi:hypothetical protein